MATSDLSHVIAATKALANEAIRHGRRDILTDMVNIIATARDSLDKIDHGDNCSEEGEVKERRGGFSAPSVQLSSVASGENAVPVRPRKPNPRLVTAAAFSSTKRLPVRNTFQERYERLIKKEHQPRKRRRSQHRKDPRQNQRQIQLRQPERQPDTHKIFQADIPCAIAEYAEPTAVMTLAAQTIGRSGGFTLLTEKVASIQRSVQTTKKWIVVFGKAPQIGDVTFSIEVGTGREAGDVFLALFAPAVKVEGDGRGCAVCANKGHGCAGCPLVEEVPIGNWGD